MKALRFFVVSLLIFVSFSSEVIFYYSKYCPHCKRIEPILEELKSKYNFTLIKVCIEDEREKWTTFVERLRNVVLRVNDTYIAISTGTPTLVINNKYLMIGEFYSNLKECIDFGEYSLCPSGKELFTDLILNRKVKEVKAEKLSWEDLKKIVESFGKKNCIAFQAGFLPVIRCESNNRKLIFMEDFIYFYLKEKGKDPWEVFKLNNTDKNVTNIESPITKVEEKENKTLIIVLAILLILVIISIALRVIK